jgi:3-dehydroquinate dehydratase/shikimate dehydrogenase
MANNPTDNIRTLRLCREKSVPTVAFCMGEMGLPSRVLCGKFGAPMTYATFHEDRQLSPGQLSYRQMVDQFRYDQINEETVVLGVIADPVAHSLSPRVHNAAIQHAGLDMVYLPFRVPKEHLYDFIKICPELGVRGLSVTIPHKERVLKSINVLDDNVAGIRAANTIVFRDVNAYGYNTDCEAALGCLQDHLVALGESSESVFEDKTVLILGAGGAARAIAWGLHRNGAKIFICSRDYKRADGLATDIGCKSLDWMARPNFNCHIMINATPVGMHPNLDESPYEADWFDKRTLVFDTVYNPEQTLFIKYARDQGCPTVTGVEMFARQAVKQFKLFTGKPADSEVIMYEVKRAISAARY